MIKSKYQKILSITGLAICALLALGLLTVFAPCGPKPDGMWMHCHYARNFILVADAATAVFFAASLFTGARKAQIAISILLIVLALFIFLEPGIINKMCSMATMRCHALTKPFARIFAILIAFFSLAKIIVASKKK